MLKDYQRAIADFDHAFELQHYSATILIQRGLTYLWMRDTRRAAIDYSQVLEIDSKYLHNGWMALWAGMSQDKLDSKLAERFEEIAATDPDQYAAFACRGVAMWLRRNFDKALQEFERAIHIASENWDIHFWKGMAYISLDQEEEAMVAIERALELGLPPILLTPLRWFERDRTDFYQKYVVPLMARYDLM
jgi:tetratricopeptide (TPR) repeat protein